MVWFQDNPNRNAALPYSGKNGRSRDSRNGAELSRVPNSHGRLLFLGGAQAEQNTTGRKKGKKSIPLISLKSRVSWGEKKSRSLFLCLFLIIYTIRSPRNSIEPFFADFLTAHQADSVFTLFNSFQGLIYH